MHELEPSRLKGIDRARLEAVVAPIVSAHGAEVVEIEWKSDRAGWVLRIFVEKAGAAEQNLSTEAAAVDLELCADVARDLSPALDVADLIAHNYHLEISSPGIERPLRGERDFLRFAGQKARLKLSEPVEEQRVLRGTLGPIEGSELLVLDGRRTFRVPMKDIASAQLVFELTPAPKPGKGPKPGSKPGKGEKPKGPHTSKASESTATAVSSPAERAGSPEDQAFRSETERRG